jgi:dolichol-phosphate mannosyltransferase
MYSDVKWATVVPLANEEHEFGVFTDQMTVVLDRLKSGKVYLVVDLVSKDRTLDLCRKLSSRDSRYVTVWAPQNRNVVDAYLNGFRAALENDHDFIIEMDAGLSHDPRAIPMFLRAFHEGNDCAFGSRFINGGSMSDSPLLRRLLSKGGSILANLLLGTKIKDMTSGYEGFSAIVLRKLLQMPLRSRAHFYQTEVRYLLRYQRAIEVPIHYSAPSPRVSRGAVSNSLAVLAYYFWRRITFRPLSVI